MMRPTEISLGALCAVAIIAAGCSTPPSHLYTLSSNAPPPAATAPLNVSIMVGPISIPAIVDLPQIVVSSGANQITIDEFNRWASPLQNNISRVVAQNLVALLGTSRVALFQQSINLDANYRVAIEVQSFDSRPGTAAALNAVWIVRRTRDGKSITGRTTVSEPTAAAGYEALAAAHSQALARMSQEIADAIRELDRA